MLKKIIPALAAIVVAAPALAGDLPSMKSAPLPPPVVVAYDWTGFYLGADLGGAWAQGQYSGPFATVNVNGDLIMGGAFLGYNRQYGSFVVGLEGDVQGLGVDRTLPGTNLRVQQNLLASINGRLGFAFDRVLVYAIGGVAFSDTKFSDDLAASYSNSNAGFDVGGGIEYAFLPNWTLRAEYRYYDFGKVSATTARLVNFSFDKTDSTVRVGVAYKFGAPAPVAVVAKY